MHMGALTSAVAPFLTYGRKGFVACILPVYTYIFLTVPAYIFFELCQKLFGDALVERWVFVLSEEKMGIRFLFWSHVVSETTTGGWARGGLLF